VRLRVPFTLSRTDVDDVERGSPDLDWDPVKDPPSSWRTPRTGNLRGLRGGVDRRHPQVQLTGPCVPPIRGDPRT